MRAGRRSMVAAGAAAVLGLGATAVAAAWWPRETARAAHPAALFWLGLSVGALPILMTRHLTGGRWGEATERLARAVAAPLPVGLAAYLVLLVLGMPSLFEWTKPAEELPEVVRHKLLYLNLPFFAARTVVVFAVWAGLAAALGVWRERRQPLRPGLGAGGTIAWVLATTVFAFDWLMSLEPRWYSDIFGLVVCLSFIVPAVASVLLLACRSGTDSAVLSDFASLWLATILGWAFLAFSQYLIIWMGNLPDEVDWYIHRSTAGWRVLSWLNVLLLAALPFLALLSGRLKRRPWPLAVLAVGAVAGHASQMLWLVLPTFHPEQLTLPWQAAAVWTGLGGLWCGWVGFVLSGRRFRQPAAGREVAHG